MLRSEQKRLVDREIHAKSSNPWDQRPRETGKAYDYFLLYRDMGLRRSLTELARMFATSPLNMRKIAMRNDWELRIGAWDAKLAKIRDEAAIEEAKAMGARHARLGMRLQEVGEERLEQFAKRTELQEQLTASDTIRLIKEGAEIERSARGEDPDKGKQGNIIFNINLGGTGAGGVPKWAPKTLQVVEGQVITDGDGDKSKEGTTPPTATVHRQG